MEKVASEEYHIDIFRFGQAHDLVERPPRVISTLRITFIVADMIISCHENADSVRF
jgi:hypothetical protein